MWTFFDHLLEFIKSIQWKSIWDEITKIPKWLRNFMGLSFCLAAFYFMYTKPLITADVNKMQSEVVSLNKKVSDVISVNDYSVDLEYMITALYVLEELNELVYNLALSNRDYIESTMKYHVTENDIKIKEMQMTEDRINQLHIALKAQLRQMINKFQPDSTIIQ